MEEKVLIKFRNIVKEFDGTIVLKGINLDIYENEFVTLLGPSGCGKTTLLRILGGFLEADEGVVIFDDEDIKELPPYKRELNTVFQKYALFPHMTVADNIGYGLKLKKIPKAEIKKRVSEMLELVQLPGYEKRKPSELSGGQRQRVAIARSLVNNPKVLLLDEPLGALDLQLRRAMQIELKHLQKKLGITFIYVTHDQTEAMTMADRIVVMKEGVIQQVGTPQEIYAAPVNLFVASFIGTPQMNFIPGKLSETGFENESFRLSLPDALKAKLRSSIGKEVILGLRPEALAVSEGIQENTIPVRLEEVEYMGRYQIVHAMVGGSSLVLSVPSDVKINPEFYVSLSMDKAHFFDGETTRSLLCREVEENHA